MVEDGWMDAIWYQYSRRLVLESSVMVIMLDVLMLHYGPSCGKSFGVLQFVVWVHLAMGRRWVAGLSGSTWNNLVKEDTAVKDMVRTHSELNSDTLFELAVCDLPPAGENRERQDLIVSRSLDRVFLYHLCTIWPETIRFFILVHERWLVSHKINYLSIECTWIEEHTDEMGSEQLICVGHTSDVIVPQNHKGITHPCTWSGLVIMGMLLVSFKWVLVSTGVESDKRCARGASRVRLVCSRTCTTNRPHRDSGLILTFLSIMFRFTGIDEIVIEGGLGVGCEPAKHMNADFLLVPTNHGNKNRSVTQVTT